MPLTHYPKLDSNVIFQWRWPRPPTKIGFLGRRHPKNLMTEKMTPGQTIVAYHSAQNFTRFYGSIYADIPLEIAFDFSNDEYDENGDYITNENISELNYDAPAERKIYKPKTGDKFFVTIFGRWLRVKITSEKSATNMNPCEKFRLTVRASVF